MADFNDAAAQKEAFAERLIKDFNAVSTESLGVVPEVVAVGDDVANGFAVLLNIMNADEPCWYPDESVVQQAQKIVKNWNEQVPVFVKKNHIII